MGVDDDRFAGLYARHHRAVVAYCARRVGAESAEDLAAEVFTVAWRRRQMVPDPEAALPWLYGVAGNVVANHRRSVRRRTGLVGRIGGLAHSPMPSVEAQVVRSAEDEAVVEAVNDLRPHDREILLLSAWEGMSAPQLAERFSISRAAAEKRLSRAKRRLATSLARVERRVRIDPAQEQEGS